MERQFHSPLGIKMQGSGVCTGAVGSGLMHSGSLVCQMRFSGKARQIGHGFHDSTCPEAEIISSVV